MRHCFSEDVAVFTAHGRTLPDLLRDAADEIEALPDFGYCMVHTYFDVENGYSVTLYAH